MAKNSFEIPSQVSADFIEHLYNEYDEVTSVSYQQLLLQHASSNMGRTLVGHLMEVYFNVPDVPENHAEEYEQGVL